MIKDGVIKTFWIQINDNMITNTAIQTKKKLEEEHYLHHSQCNEIIRLSREFIEAL